MFYYSLNGTEMTASALALGTANYGVTLQEEACFRQMDTYLDGGGNLLDTAHVYGNWAPGELHKSEKIIGRYLAASGKRNKVLLATKGAHPPVFQREKRRVSQREIQEDLNGSLRCLQTDYIDLYFLHRDDPAVPVGEICEWMQGWITQGKIRYWGCSNWAPERIRAALSYEKEHGFAGLACDQAMHSYAFVQAEKLADPTLVPLNDDSMRLHKNTGLNLLAFTPQAKGYFSRAARQDPLPTDLAEIYESGENSRKLAFLVRASQETDLSIAQLTLLYFSTLPFPAVPITAFRTQAYFEEAIAAFTQENRALAQRLSFI